MTSGTTTGHHRVTSEVGRLRTVLLHRPGAELSRLTPRNTADLLFDGVPWLGRAQEEHDAFAAALRERDVEVLYLTDLLVEALEVQAARDAQPAVLRRSDGRPRRGARGGIAPLCDPVRVL